MDTRVNWVWNLTYGLNSVATVWIKSISVPTSPSHDVMILDINVLYVDLELKRISKKHVCPHISVIYKDY